MTILSYEFPPHTPVADDAPLLTPGGVDATAEGGAAPPSSSAARRGRQKGDSYFFQEAGHDANVVRRLQAVTVTRCLFCADSFEGSAQDGMAWSRQHREEQHPQARDRGQRVRERQAKAIGGPVYTAWSGR